jgi:hypothetical protein
MKRADERHCPVLAFQISVIAAHSVARLVSHILLHLCLADYDNAKDRRLGFVVSDEKLCTLFGSKPLCFHDNH